MLRPGAGQRIGGGDRAESVGEEQDRGAEQARPQNRQRDIAPILRRGRAEDGRSLPPLLLQPVERRHEDQHHQRDLEIEVGDRQTPEAQDIEAEPRRLMPSPSRKNSLVTRPSGTERGNEGEGERNAGKIRRDAAEGGDQRTQERAARGP